MNHTPTTLTHDVLSGGIEFDYLQRLEFSLPNSLLVAREKIDVSMIFPEGISTN